MTAACRRCNCDVGDWLFSLLNRAYVGRVFAYANSGFNEIWFHWPDEGSLECNRYAAVDFTSAGREWIIGAMDRTAADKRSAMAHPLLADIDGNVHDPRIRLDGERDDARREHLRGNRHGGAGSE